MNRLSCAGGAAGRRDRHAASACHHDPLTHVAATGRATAAADGSFSVPAFGTNLGPPGMTIAMELIDPFGNGSNTAEFRFGTQCPADLNRDGVQNVFDVLRFFELFGASCDARG